MAEPINQTETKYIEGSLLPDMWTSWRDWEKKLIPFASEPHTCVLTVANRKTPATIEFTKTGGFTGYDTNPDLKTEWIHGEIDLLKPGLYDGLIVATRYADGKPRKMAFTLRIERRPGSAVDPGPASPPT